MGAFVGENPNGSWTLTVNDLFTATVGDDGGALNTWSLVVEDDLELRHGTSQRPAGRGRRRPVLDRGGREPRPGRLGLLGP